MDDLNLLMNHLQQYRNKKILRLVVRIDKLKAERDELIKSEQEICKHPHVAECEYEKLNSDSCLPPRLKCLNCGLEVDDWHWDKKGMGGSPKFKIDRQDLYKLRY